MDLTFTDEQLAFRDELRAWLRDNPPGERPTTGEDDEYAWARDWQRRLNDGGWAGVHWPKEFGGRGASLTETAIFFEELGASRAPLPANVLGLLLGGPTVMVWGTDEQKERHLPPILSAEEIWCQGFSEPDAGSDLAALKTRAVQDGDEWVVTGQKVWTSGAQYAKWCMLVARTDTEAAKHKGLTYFLMDMEQDAVQVRPLRQITGESEFNEIFMEEAYIPDENVVGQPGEGWNVAITTLMNERSGIAFGSAVAIKIALGELMELVRERGLDEDPVIRQKMAQLYIESETLRLNAYRGLTGTMKRGYPGPEGSLPKWQWSDLNQALTELAMEVRGAEGPVVDDKWTYRFLRARANSIEGGTTEILKNIIAERVLGLPRMR
jgi:alkylation response protein AidB-like acyl-CoA dehydrogenase